jgi:predicted Rossmann fold flavoprotein
MLRRMNIQTEEREHGRIFCRKSAEEVVLYLVRALEEADVHFSLNTVVSDVKYAERFCIESTNRKYESSRLLLATGGLAWPQIGATGIGYTIARQFGHTIAPLRPALVGLTLPPNSPLLNLQGISLDVNLQIKGKSPVIAEPLLFTHKGISGPSVLQISCFWTKGDHITVNFLPSDNVIRQMHDPNNGKLLVKNLLMRSLPERLVRALIPEQLMERKVAEVGKKDRQTLAECVHSYMVLPFDVEGFSKAEATLGGVCTDEIYPQSMESRLVKGLFFSGEVIDITGKLGGYNIHWAFASGYVAGQNI